MNAHLSQSIFPTKRLSTISIDDQLSAGSCAELTRVATPIGSLIPAPAPKDLPLSYYSSSISKYRGIQMIT